MAEETLEAAKPRISTTQILQDLKDGIERYPNKEDASKPSIQEKYGLRRVDVINLFKHADLKGKKVHTGKAKSTTGRKPRATIGFTLVDDAGNDITSEVFNPTATTAAPSAGNGNGNDTNDTTANAETSTQAPQESVEANSGW